MNPTIQSAAMTDEQSTAYDMIDRQLQNSLHSDEDYAEYSKALDTLALAARPVTPAPDLLGEINNYAYHGIIYLQEKEPGNAEIALREIVSLISKERAALAAPSTPAAAAPEEMTDGEIYAIHEVVTGDKMGLPHAVLKTVRACLLATKSREAAPSTPAARYIAIDGPELREMLVHARAIGAHDAATQGAPSTPAAEDHIADAGNMPPEAA